MALLINRKTLKLVGRYSTPALAREEARPHYVLICQEKDLEQFSEEELQGIFDNHKFAKDSGDLTPRKVAGALMRQG